MKRKFEIEWPDSLGSDWMNTYNLLFLLNETCPNTRFTVWDITGWYVTDWDVTESDEASEHSESAGTVNESENKTQT